MRFFKSRFFKKVFFSYALLLGALVCIFCALLGFQIWEGNRIRQQSEVQSQAEQMAQIVDAKFNTVELMALQMTKSDWFPYAASEADVLFSQIDYFKMREICNELERNNVLLQISDLCAVLFPEKNLVIDGIDFWNTEQWLELEGLPSNLINQINSSYPYYYSSLILLSDEQTTSQDSFIIAKKLKSDKVAKGIMLIRVNYRNFSNYIETSLPEVVRFSISQQEVAAYTMEKDPLPGNLKEVEIPSGVYNWNYEFALHGIENTDNGLLWKGLSIAVCGIVTVLLLSYWLAIVTQRPIKRLIQRIDSTEDIDHYSFEQIEHIFEVLDAEKKQAENLANQYLRSNQNAFLHSLLQGTFSREHIRENLQRLQLPLSLDMVYMVVMFVNLDKDKKKYLLDGILNIDIYFVQEGCATALYSEEETGCYSLIIGVPEAKKVVLTQAEDVHVLVDKFLPEQDVGVYVGSVYKDISGICLSYGEAEKSMRMKNYQKDQLSYYFPMDIELDIRRLLHLREFEKAEQHLLLLEQENRKRRVLPDVEKKLIDILYESIARYMIDIDMSTTRSREIFLNFSSTSPATEMWNFLRLMLLDIQNYCSLSDPFQARGRLFEKYVIENYACTNLSQQDIAEKFNVSRSTVSKVFKETTQMNFIDYLSRLRVEHAKQLFSKGENDVSKVAKLSGFEAEITFKRAFLKWEGITPREYMKHHSQL